MADACPNCSAPLKGGFLPNPPVDAHDLDFIRQTLDAGIAGACAKCGPDLIRKATEQLLRRRDQLKIELEALLVHVQLVSTHSPFEWRYTAKGLVTAQSVTGTGMFSEVASAFTDLFGTQSGSYNSKLRAGEDLCRASLRAQAIELGGNAVIAVDVDYAEVGGQRAMLMVCMTGTAVELTNPDIVALDLEDNIGQIRQKRAIYAGLSKLGRSRHLF